jgi:glycosyltransferase involved in cell wall biosynthesis
VTLTLAIDARMHAHSGIGTYITQVVPRLVRQRPEWEFVLIGDPAAWDALADAPNVRTRSNASPIYGAREQWEIARLVPGGALLWVPHFNVPLAWRGPLFVTVHDLFHLAMPRLAGGPHRRAYAHLLLERVRRHAAGVAFDSAFTEREFLRLVGTPHGQATVVHLGVDSGWSRIPPAPSPRPRPYFLYVGNVKEHKNLSLLVRAFRHLIPDTAFDLVVAGQMEGMRTHDDSILRLAAESGGRIVLTGKVPDALLRQLVAHAEALVIPSLYEGFGLPALEAMAAGCPVIASTAASLPEVCGDAALAFDPHSEAALHERLREIAHAPSLRADLRTRGLARAAGFTWERCAAETATAIASAAARRVAR